MITKIFSKPKLKVKTIEPLIEKSLQKNEIDFEKTDLDSSNFKIKKLTQKSVFNYNPPPFNFLENEPRKPVSSGDLRTNLEIIKRTLKTFSIPVEMGEINIGPTVTQYTLKPSEGIKLSKITSLINDLSLALAAHPLRIEAPIPGKSLVGIEIPNKIRVPVKMKSLILYPEFQNIKSRLVFALGKDVAGNPIFPDLKKMPHLLIAGSTGSGKTITLNNIIISLIYKNSPNVLRFILIDPKRVEFSFYNNLPHLLSPIILDVQKAIVALKWLIKEMERRFKIFQKIKAREIDFYNKIASVEKIRKITLYCFNH